MSWLLLLAAALTLLQAFDGWTTYQIHKAGGFEKNSLVREVIAKIGLYPALLLFKVGAAVLCWVLVLLPVVDQLTATIRLTLLVMLALWYGWVAWHNWMVYRKQRRL